MSRSIVVLILVGVGLVFAGCGADQCPTQMTLQITTGAAVGANIRLLPITSEKYGFADKAKEIRARLEGEINSGKRNIVAVKTSYSSGHLMSSEITYDASDTGDVNNLRVLFIYSDKFGWDDQMKEVKLQLNDIMNSGKYDIVKIQTVYTNGRLIAAEVYYRSK